MYFIFHAVLYFPGSKVTRAHRSWFLPSIVMGSLLRRAHFESLRAAEAKNSATINQLKYRSRSCITANIALGAWSRAIFAVMHSHGTLTSIYCMKPPNIKAPKCTLFSRVKGHKCSPILPQLIASIVGGSILWRANFESLKPKTRLQSIA